MLYPTEELHTQATKSVFVHTYWFSAKRALSEPQSNDLSLTYVCTGNNENNSKQFMHAGKPIQINNVQPAAQNQGRLSCKWSVLWRLQLGPPDKEKHSFVTEWDNQRISSLILPEIPRVGCEVWAFIFIIITAGTIHFRSLDLVSEP